MSTPPCRWGCGEGAGLGQRGQGDTPDFPRGEPDTQRMWGRFFLGVFSGELPGSRAL